MVGCRRREDIRGVSSGCAGCWGAWTRDVVGREERSVERVVGDVLVVEDILVGEMECFCSVVWKSRFVVDGDLEWFTVSNVDWRTMRSGRVLLVVWTRSRLLGRRKVIKEL